MEDNVLEKARLFAMMAKANGSKEGGEKVKLTFTSDKRDSLSEVIKTEEQAKAFMALLKSF